MRLAEPGGAVRHPRCPGGTPGRHRLTKYIGSWESGGRTFGIGPASQLRGARAHQRVAAKKAASGWGGLELAHVAKPGRSDQALPSRMGASAS